MPVRRRTDWRSVKIAVGVVGGAFALVVILAVAAVAFLGTRQPAQATRRFPANTGGDAAVGASAVIAPTDLSAEWTLLRRSIVPASQLHQADATCPAEPAAVLRATSQVVSEYSYDLTQSGMEAGHMTSSVITYATPDQAKSALAFFTTDAYQACEERRTIAHVTRPPDGLRVQNIVTTPLHVDSVPDALGLRFRVEASGHTGDDALVFDAIHYQVGRTIAVFRYSWCPCSSADAAAIESANADTVGARLDADIRTRSA